MSVITISRGTFSGGKTLAEGLSSRLGFRLIDREVIVTRAVAHGISEKDLRSALERPPAAQGTTLEHKKYIYLALFQAALTEEVRAGRAIYHGLLGNLLLQGGSPILRLRVIAPLGYRIRITRERLGLNHAEAVAHIERMDQDRRKWTRYLYGVDWEDPTLYDLIVNLGHIGIDDACRAVAGMIQGGAFELTPERQAVMDDLALGARAKAELALNPFTANLEVGVEARGGSVAVTGELYEQAEEVERVIRAIPGVTDLAVRDLSPAG